MSNFRDEIQGTHNKAVSAFEMTDNEGMKSLLAVIVRNTKRELILLDALEHISSCSTWRVSKELLYMSKEAIKQAEEV